MSLSFAGAWPVMVTPYHEDLSIDEEAYRAMIEWYLTKPVGGLYANCLTSEMYHLSNPERLKLVRMAAEISNGKLPVAATGNLGTDISQHIEFCRQVRDAGADVVMLVVPEFCQDDTELERYYLTLAEKLDAPLGLYECPVPRS